MFWRFLKTFIWAYDHSCGDLVVPMGTTSLKAISKAGQKMGSRIFCMTFTLDFYAWCSAQSFGMLNISRTKSGYWFQTSGKRFLCPHNLFMGIFMIIEPFYRPDWYPSKSVMPKMLRKKCKKWKIPLETETFIIFQASFPHCGPCRGNRTGAPDPAKPAII